MKNEKLYQVLANKLNEIIPEHWENILLYAEVNEFARTVYFYYYPQNKPNPIYSLDIEDLFLIDNNKNNAKTLDMEKTIVEIWENSKLNNGEIWEQMTFILDSTGKFRTEYSYEEVKDPVDEKKMWMKKYLF